MESENKTTKDENCRKHGIRRHPWRFVNAVIVIILLLELCISLIYA
jgi:hypothetical protein